MIRFWTYMGRTNLWCIAEMGGRFAALKNAEFHGTHDTREAAFETLRCHAAALAFAKGTGTSFPSTMDDWVETFEAVDDEPTG